MNSSEEGEPDVSPKFFKNSSISIIENEPYKPLRNTIQPMAISFDNIHIFEHKPEPEYVKEFQEI